MGAAIFHLRLGAVVAGRNAYRDPSCAAARKLSLQCWIAAADQITPALLKASFSSHPQLIETTEGSLAKSLITLLRQSPSLPHRMRRSRQRAWPLPLAHRRRPRRASLPRSESGSLAGSVETPSTATT